MELHERGDERRPDVGRQSVRIRNIDAEAAQRILHTFGDALLGIRECAVQVEEQIPIGRRIFGNRVEEGDHFPRHLVDMRGKTVIVITGREHLRILISLCGSDAVFIGDQFISGGVTDQHRLVPVKADRVIKGKKPVYPVVIAGDRSAVKDKCLIRNVFGIKEPDREAAGIADIADQHGRSKQNEPIQLIGFETRAKNSCRACLGVAAQIELGDIIEPPGIVDQAHQLKSPVEQCVVMKRSAAFAVAVQFGAQAGITGFGEGLRYGYHVGLFHMSGQARDGEDHGDLRMIRAGIAVRQVEFYVY